MSWASAGTPEEEIRRLARRDFGPDAADPVIAAWRDFSEAMGHIPYLTHGYYRGPSFIGPGQPLMLEEKDMPRALFGRFFYLAENDLSEGTAEALSLRPIYASDIKTTPAERADMDRAAALWDRGVGTLAAARAKVDGFHRREFEREMDMAAYLGTVFRAAARGNHFFARRAEYQSLLDPARRSPASEARAARILEEMESMVREDWTDARAALQIVRRDPRLDLSIRLDLDFEPLDQIIAAKIVYAEGPVRAQFAAARRRRP